MIKDENVRITITIPKTLHRLLKKDALSDARSVSSLVLKILKLYYNIENDD